MSQQLQNLQLETAQILVPTRSFREQDRLLRDLQTIHDPSKSKIQNYLQRLTKINHFTLTDNPEESRPSLSGIAASATLFENQATIWWEKPTLPKAKMGFAAVHLYAQLSKGESCLERLSIVDPLEETLDKADYRDATAAVSHMLWKRSIGEESNFEEYDDGLMFHPPLHDLDEPGTKLFALNKRRLPLPKVLRTIKDAYDEMYIGANTSAAVASIVGATSLEAFEAAWDDAAKYAPTDAARRLLDNMATISAPDSSS